METEAQGQSITFRTISDANTEGTQILSSLPYSSLLPAGPKLDL